jgi:hypothetical protein
MVLGFGEGNIEIVLDEDQLFEPGKTIKGKVKLDLKDRKKAKKLRIEFYGEIETYERRRGKSERVTKQVNKKSKTLGEEKEYPAGVSEYEFEIQLPQVKARERAKDILGKIFDFVAPDPLWKARWYLDSSLDLSMAFDINQKMQVDFRI